jgi:amino acid adenylation domain-containing protein/thioester reductase-like protein
MHQIQESLLRPRTGLQQAKQVTGEANPGEHWQFNPDLSLPALFNHTVKRYGENIAVIAGQDSITFKKLDEASNQVAHYLIAAGIGTGALVPVWLERSVDFITAILGIQKAGAAYIPVDYSYPEKRFINIINDAGAGTIITSAGNKQHLPAGLNTVCISDGAIRQQPVTEVPLSAQPDSLAYVIYTSGSTGTPKGVMITQRSIQHLVTWHAMHFNVTPESRLSFAAGTSFDIGVWEIWTALTSGAALYIANDEERTNAIQLLGFIERHQLTHAFAPTILVPEIVEASKGRSLPLRYLFTGGEKLKPVNTKDIPYTLIDYYGPTECTVFATYHVVNRPDGAYVSSIGHPIAHTQAFILDSRLEPVPAEAIGELCIGGICLSTGYWNKEQITAEKFVDHPFHKEEKLYRTGDLARRLPDGSIEFLGRTDNQVKVRGYRIELGEIESTLLKVSYINNAVVLVKENNKQQKTLVAILQLKPGTTPPSSDEKAIIQDLRQHIKQVLPAYMIPSYYYFKEHLPVNINGKTDIQKLREELESTEVSPLESMTGATEMETSIMQVWSDLLEHTSFDTTDNFFDIGGNSLLVAAASVDISRRMDVKVYLRDLYQYPTVRSLAEVLSLRKQSAAAIPQEDTEPVIELQKDVYLDPDTTFNGNFDPAILLNPSQIFLTGVSGFIGINLLEELLLRTGARIHCLVRSKNEYDGWLKIEEAAKRFRVTLPQEARQRVVLVPGDLTQENMGLPQEQYDYLTETIQLIYHSASSVNFIEPYSYNKAANVEGLRRLIRFAGKGKLKCLSLLSTISVYSWGHKFTGKTVMTEEDGIQQNLLSVSKDIGYVRSKYVMEAVADLAASQGLPVMTYRLGYAMCHSKTGACATYQWWSSLIKVCLRYNAYPALVELREGLITVDYMVQSLAHITSQPDAIGKKFNLIASPSNNLTLEQFFELLNTHYGFNLKKVPYKEWRAYWENDNTCPLYPLTSLFRDNMHEGLSTVELYQNTYVWDNQQVRNRLEGSNVIEPEFNKALFDNYLSYLGIKVTEPVTP